MQPGQQRQELVRLLADPAADDDELRGQQRLDVLQVLVDVPGPVLPAQVLRRLGPLGGALLRVLAADLQVTELGVGDQHAIDEQRAADPGAERHHVDRARLVLAGAERHLRNAGCVRVVQQPDLLPGRPGQQGPGVQPDPGLVQVGRRPGHPVDHHPGKGDAGGTGPGKGLHELVYDLGHRVRDGRTRRRDLHPVGRERARVQIDGGCLDPGSADIDAQCLHACSFSLPDRPSGTAERGEPRRRCPVFRTRG